MLRNLSILGLTILVQFIIIMVGGFTIKLFEKSLIQAQTKVGNDEFDHYNFIAKTVVLSVEQ